MRFRISNLSQRTSGFQAVAAVVSAVLTVLQAPLFAARSERPEPRWIRICFSRYTTNSRPDR